MAQWQVIDGSIGPNQAIDINSADDTPTAWLGQRICCRDTASTDYGIAEFIYLKGVASTAVGSAVTFSAGSFQTALATANAKGQIGFAMAATVADQYGWYQICGKAVGKVLASFASGNVAYLTATAGSLDDAVVAGDEVYGSLSVSAIGTPSTGLALISINYPFVTDASN